MEFIRSLLYKNLQDLRKERGLTQKTVADAIGVSQSSYGRWEAGEWISPESIEKLAQFYGVRSSRFFYDPDLNEPPMKTSAPSPKEITKKLEELIQFINK